MTCNENENTFKSVGIISVKCKPGCQTKLLFTPNSEHSVSDGTKIYAVFLPTCKCKCTQGVATPICGSLKSVPITVCDCAKLPDLVAAATQQTAVEVEVEKVPEKEGKPVWTLKSITIPAPKSITIPAPCRKK